MVDDNESAVELRDQGRRVRHALHFLYETNHRWRANIWIASHNFLMIAISAAAAGVELMRQPWTSSRPHPDRDAADTFHTRMLVCVPVSLILLLLCAIHAVHVGGGRGTRRIGRRKRLLCRGVCALLVFGLPFLVWLDPAAFLYNLHPDPDDPTLYPSPPPPPASAGGPPAMPPPAPPPALARWRQVAESSTLFLSLLTFLLLCELGLETYGRGYVDEAQNEHCGAGRANSIACAATAVVRTSPRPAARRLAHAAPRGRSSTSTYGRIGSLSLGASTTTLPLLPAETQTRREAAKSSAGP